MPHPEQWLHATIEKAAECRAYPVFVPRDVELPFVYFSRRSTDREHHTVGPAGVPVAQFEITCYAPQYLQAKDLATAVRLAVDNFSGDAAGVTILQTRVTDESDGEPEFFTGEDVPTYSATLSLELRYSEES